MLDRGAIESLLRPYGPPATQLYHAVQSDPDEERISFLPYVVAVSINWDEVGAEDEANYTQRETVPDDGNYHGWSKVALESIFDFWQSEEIVGFNKSFKGRDSVWGDTLITYRLPIR